jgi:Ras-related protein Rab-7A
MDNKLTILLVGDTYVGKSSFLTRVCDDNHSIFTNSTIGVDYRIFNYSYKNGNVRLCLWDTAGTERFRELVGSYYAGADIIILMCDCTNNESIRNVKDVWYRNIKNCLGFRKCPKIFIVINKLDVESDMNIVKDLKEYSNEYVQKSLFPEVPSEKTYFISVRTGENVQNMLKNMLDIYYLNNVFYNTIENLEIKNKKRDNLACCNCIII